MRPALILLVWIIVIMLGVQAPSASEDISAEERNAILAFGPWPPAARPDTSNRYSGNAPAIALGKQLFFDRRLSKDNLLSCADCHQPDQHFTDGVALNRGHGKIARHTPSVVNLRWNHWFGWGGEADSLWAQSIRPIISKNEMAGTTDLIRNAVVDDQLLSCQFRHVFKSDPSQLDDDQLLVSIGKVLAAYQETLISGQSAFDLFRDGIDTGDSAAINSYPKSARRGLKIFIGEGRCNLCHFGPRLTNGEFADIGVPFFISKGQIDKGRFGGIQALKKNPYNLLGKYNDDTNGKSDVRTLHVEVRHRNWGEFKVPSLRGVADTAPYMHNGSVETLDDVINFYSELNEERLHTDGEKILRPLNLTPRQKSDLKAFLQSLSALVYDNAVDTNRSKTCQP
jgi:cytochrome c peroxidase